MLVHWISSLAFFVGGYAIGRSRGVDDLLDKENAVFLKTMILELQNEMKLQTNEIRFIKAENQDITRHVQDLNQQVEAQAEKLRWLQSEKEQQELQQLQAADVLAFQIEEMKQANDHLVVRVAGLESTSTHARDLIRPRVSPKYVTIKAFNKYRSSMSNMTMLLHRYVMATSTTVATLKSLLACIDPESNRNEFTFTGCNVNIRNGLNSTETQNGKGNLIVGYNEGESVPSSNRNGSHNIVVGCDNRYTSFGGIISGIDNSVSGQHASCIGGAYNEVHGAASVAVAGVFGTVNGFSSAAVSGSLNVVNGYASAAVSGTDNTVNGSYHAMVTNRTFVGACMLHDCP